MCVCSYTYVSDVSVMCVLTHVWFTIIIIGMQSTHVYSLHQAYSFIYRHVYKHQLFQVHTTAPHILPYVRLNIFITVTF